MKVRVPGYYKAFECIASACEDTCCAGWDVVIDAQTYQCYQNLEGAFGERLRRKMVVDEDGDNIFILDGDRCPFLNSKNLCDIYDEQGEAYLCHTCKQYPRYMEEYADIREMGISLSCPEAARIILGHEQPTAFEFTEDGEETDMVHGDDADILEEFFRCRAVIIDILERADIPFGVGAAIVLRFVQAVQDKIDFSEMAAINEIIGKYDDPDYLKELVKTLNAYEGNGLTKYQDVQAYLKTFRELEHISGNDPLGLTKVLRTYWHSEEDSVLYRDKHKAFNHQFKEETDKFKKILLYFIYRYFMKSFYDFDMQSKIKVALMSTIMIKELAVAKWIETGTFTDADMVDISHRYSKDIEHLEKNIETLERVFESEDVYTVDKLINTLMNEF